MGFLGVVHRKIIGGVIDEKITAFHLSQSKDFGSLTGIDKRNLLSYFEDHRNNKVIAVQVKVCCNVYGYNFIGAADQLRENEHGFVEVWEIKYSKLEPKKLAQRTLPQLLVYANSLGVEVGGIVNVYNYSNKTPVFHRIQVNNVTVALRDTVLRLGE